MRSGLHPPTRVSASNPRAVTLSGKLRTITNVPGGMWLEDLRNGTVLAVANHQRLGIRGMAPGGKEEHELGWFGWSELRDISRDGRKILFEEEGDGGDRITPCFCAIRMDRLRRELARASRWPSRPMGNG